MRRVVITGYGLVTPLGIGSELIWNKLINGESGISYITKSKGKCKSIPKGCLVNIAGQVPIGDEPTDFNEIRLFGRSVSNEYALNVQYAIQAADIALDNSKLKEHLNNELDHNRIGVTIGTGGIGPLDDILEGAESCKISLKKLSPYYVPKILVNMPAGQVSIRYGLKGPVHSVATACAAGTHSIGDAYNFIRLNYADIMLAGGSDASLGPMSLSGFSRMKALSTGDITASRPFDSTRNGFIIGEGAGIIVLEELSSALTRNADIIAEVLGYGITGDAYHTTAPSTGEQGGGFRAMNQAIHFSGIKIGDIGYVNAHATSTQVGDEIESNSIDRIFNSNTRKSPLYVSSCKGALGHLLGAAGAVETIFTSLSLRDGIIPPTLNLHDPNPLPTSYSHVTEKNFRVPGLQYALKNSFGFGGMNGVLLLGKYS
eukprot:gene16826-22310_t